MSESIVNTYESFMKSTNTTDMDKEVIQDAIWERKNEVACQIIAQSLENRPEIRKQIDETRATISAEIEKLEAKIVETRKKMHTNKSFNDLSDEEKEKMLDLNIELDMLNEAKQRIEAISIGFESSLPEFMQSISICT